MSYPLDRRSLRRVIEGLALFEHVLDDSIGRAARTLAVEPAHAPAARLVSLLAEDAEQYPEELVGDAWQNHLLDRILAADNVFSRKAEREPLENIGDRLLSQVRRELAVLHDLYSQGSLVLAAEAHSALGDDRAPSWAGHKPLAKGPAIHTPEALALKQELAASADWPALLPQLAAIYARAGIGDFSRFPAFRWDHGREGDRGHLEGVAHPDPIRLEDLVGYDRERESVVRNAERFAAGHPANHALLFGERGTGKSSTVKAILNANTARGLRLIDLPSEYLQDLPQILDQIRERKQRFILFVDDLSFEEGEAGFKPLRAVLEGSIEVQPDNVLVYATSNRHPGMDATEDRASLSDRFGLRVWFGEPDQDLYIKIVDALAARQGIQLPSDQLHDRARAWVEQHSGRSGRTARQFIDALAGELALP